MKETVKDGAVLAPVKKGLKEVFKNKGVKQDAVGALASEKKTIKKEEMLGKKGATAAENFPSFFNRPSPLAPIPDVAAISKSGKKAKKGKKAAHPALSDGPAKKTKGKNKKAKDVGGKAKDADAAFKTEPKKATTKMQNKKAAIKEYKKQKKLRAKKGKEKPAPKSSLEPVPFDEEKFKAIVCVDNIHKIAEALRKQVGQEVAAKKTTIFSDFCYYLNVVSFKIANCPKRMVKLSLKHSLVDKDDDVVIIVTDLKRGAKVDYEETIHHYEDVFREAGIEGLKIMPFNQLRKECGTFEAVRKFSNTYDYFLCDGRVVKHVTGFCGKIFQKPRTVFHAVRMQSSKVLKSDIEKALRRTAFKQLAKGNLISIPVGNHKFTMQQLAENVDHVVAQLKTLHPGGLGNIRAMHLRIDIVGTSSLPLYISMAEAPPDTPYVVGTRERRMLEMKKEANEVLSKFRMTKDAEIIKLTKDQIEKKRKIKEEMVATAKSEEVPKDDDGEETAVPAKKAKKEEKAEAADDFKTKSSDEQVEPEYEDDEDPEDDSEDDDNVDDDDDDDDLDDDEDDENAEVEGGDDDDDDENEDDDDDEEGDEDEDQEDDESD